MDRAALGMILGGILWVVHGVFEMIAPFGAASVYDRTLGYELITERALYLLYGVPGTAALILSSFGLVALARGEAGRLVGLGRVLAFAAVGAGVLSGVGLAIGSAPLFVAPIALGTPILGAAAYFVATGARSQALADRGVLLLTGMLGLFILPLRPLVYALQVIPLAMGAALIGLFGLGWVALGWRARRGERRAS